MKTRPQPDPAYGEELRAAREAVTSAATGRRMTQQEMAEKLGCSVRLLGDWETGAKAVLPHWWRKLADAGMPIPTQTKSAAVLIAELTDRLTGTLEAAVRIVGDLEQYSLRSASEPELVAELERRRRDNIPPPVSPETAC